MGAYDGIITQAAQQLAENEARLVEQACEASIQGGKHGVLVTRNRDLSITAEVSDRVPFGVVYYQQVWL